MKKDTVRVFEIIAILVVFLFVLVYISCNATPRKLSIHMRGVYDSKITLTPFDGLRFGSPLTIAPGVKAGTEVQFVVPDSLLPGEFLIRFDYRAKETDTPYPTELPLYLNREDIHIYAHPLYLRGDSLRIVGDRENKAWVAFSGKCEQQRQQLGLLRQLLEQYDRPASPEWTQALSAYESRRTSYNHWIDSLAQVQKDLFVSHLYSFQQLKTENWKATPAARMEALTRDWFKGVNFNDTLVLRSRYMNELMNGFMGMYGARSTTQALRDSLFTEAGKLAIGLASAGHPRMYGWMVDYFYTGYETYNIVPGMKMLEKHLNNPRCLTAKRLAIAKRLEGIKKMVPGIKVHNVMVHDSADREEIINMAACDKAYRLLIFYDSECDHCRELLATLRAWYAVPANSARLDIVSVCVDSRRDVWAAATTANAFPWTDRYAPGGINSKAASDYYVLSAPYIYLMDKNGVLVGTPDSVKEMVEMIKK